MYMYCRIMDNRFATIWRIMVLSCDNTISWCCVFSVNWLHFSFRNDNFDKNTIISGKKILSIKMKFTILGVNLKMNDEQTSCIHFIHRYRRISQQMNHQMHTDMLICKVLRVSFGIHITMAWKRTVQIFWYMGTQRMKKWEPSLELDARCSVGGAFCGLKVIFFYLKILLMCVLYLEYVLSFLWDLLHDIIQLFNYFLVSCSFKNLLKI